MGLDCTAYAKIELLPDHPAGRCREDEDEDYCYEEPHVQAFCYPDQERSMAGLVVPPERFKMGSQEFSGGSWYQVSGETAESSCTYGGHTRFRRRISEKVLGIPWDRDSGDWFSEYVADPGVFLGQVDLGMLTDAPFFELLYFADNEGTIGPEAAGNLLRDFVEHEETFLTGLPEYDRMAHYWHSWRAMLSVAWPAGLIRLH